jgi:N6-adenosine-specific RNA methylase IME4
MRTRGQWVKEISAAWNTGTQQAVWTFVETGLLLIAARKDLDDHGEWLKLLGSEQELGELPFHKRVAQQLMAIARDAFFQKRGNASLLPPDYTTLYKLQTLHRRFPDRFDEWVEDGTICPTLQRNEISKILRLERVAADQERVRSLVPREGKYRTLIIDPPWDYEWLSVGGASKPGYATMTYEQLRALDAGRWADDQCHIYLWTTNNFMLRAADLMRAWGFEPDYKTVITWIKIDRKGKAKPGLGTYFRNTTEHVLFGSRGKLGTRQADTPTHFSAPVGRHSEKPEAFYEIVRRQSYLPAGEAFQRKQRDGFVNLFESAEFREAAE